MTTLDSIINILIVPVIIIFFIFIFKEPLGRLIEWIKGLFSRFRKSDGEEFIPKSIPSLYWEEV